MKKIRILVIALCLSLLFAGCGNFRLSASLDDLISPVALTGDSEGVKNALDSFCKSGYSIKIPSNGKYTTSFVFYDMDGDKNNEAIAFYEPSDDYGTVSLAVMKKNDDKWDVIESVRGLGSDVGKVDFCDLNNDGIKEIIVCWNVISKSSSYNLSVYRQVRSDDNTYSLKQIGSSVTASEFICSDINSNGIKDIIVFNVASASESPKAEMYTFKNNKLHKYGETKLDSSIISYTGIVEGETDEGVSIYADAIRSDGSSMVTEFIYWSDYYNSIVSPFYSYSSGRTNDTTRDSMLNCMDINNDKTVEIPLDKNISSLPNEITAQNWVIYKNTVLSHKCYSYTSDKDSYCLVFKDSDFSNTYVKYNKDKRVLSVYDKESKKLCFEIKTVLKSTYDASQYSQYTYLKSNSGLVYIAKTDNNSPLKITTNDLKNMIKPY